ncbi:MAG: hypothetical protein ABIJ17_02270 [Patescibacteria group bacterium]
MRKKRKDKKFRRIFLLIFLLILISFILFLSPLFKIKYVNVDNQEIKDNFDYKNIFLFTNKKIKIDLLNKFPKIADIQIKKNYFKRSIELEIEQRERLGIVCGDNCFYFDKTGFLFEDAPRTSGSLILLINYNSDLNIGKNIFNEKFINQILEIRDYLVIETFIKALNFNVEIFPITEIKVATNEGWYALFDLERDIQKQLLSLKVVLQEKIQHRENLEYIDLRIENRVYYK